MSREAPPTLHQAMALRGAVVAYSGPIAVALGHDPIAALMACQIWYWTAGAEREACQSAAFVESLLGITERRQKRAREVLVASGWLVERNVRKGGHTHVVWTMRPEAIRLDMRHELERVAMAAREKPIDVSGVGPMDVLSVGPPPPTDKTSVNKTLLLKDLNTKTPAGLDGPSEVEPKQQQALIPIEANPISIKAIETGALDTTSKRELTSGISGEKAFRALHAWWTAKWKPSSSKAVEVNRKQWNRWAGVIPPSEIVRLLIGMTFDEWAERDQHCTWNYADRQAEKFLALYKRHVVDGVPAPRRAEKAPPGCKRWKTIWIPIDYVPDGLDENNYAFGRDVFVLTTRKWHDPDRDTSGVIAKQDAAMGVGFNYPSALRARRGLA